MSTTPTQEWVDLLQTAKKIRRSVRPVVPSPGFRHHLRSDLASALGAGRTRKPANLIIVRQRPATGWAGIVLGACLGLAATGLALILLRRRR